ncbi:MAG: TrkH family potassium uptake protein [Epsilonproteobacteria bacterium]|nr:TrkH family potassium uptake protein [Campylobacterota bacterium]
MDYKSVIKFISIIGMWLSIFLLLPILIGWAYKESYQSFLYFDIFLFSINALFFLILRKHKINLKIKESILSVNLIWILLGIAGGMPLVLNTHIGYADAFFEAISGFTTTGATVYSDIESLPHMILFHRSLMHWLGGMGIIVLGVGLFSIINPTGSMSLFKAESTGIQLQKLTPKIKDNAMTLWIIYLLITLIDAILLDIAGMDKFDAVNHAFSTISTGGFSTKNASLAYWADNDAIMWITTFFMTLSGINFMAHLKLYYDDISGYKSEEVKYYLAVFFILSIALSITHYYNETSGSFYESVKHSFFTISSILTTTGFVSIDYEQWGQATASIIIIAMLIGANAGSTAGGIKVIRYVVLIKILFAEMKKILHPNAVINVFLDKQRIKSSVFLSVFGFLFLYAFTVLATALYLYIRGYDSLTSLTAALATVGNIGPGFGDVGAVDNFGFFSWYDKIFLSFSMIIGRLECYTFFLLFVRDFWRKF